MGTIFQVNESNGNVTITGAVDVGSHQIHNVTDPTSTQDAATKNYVDTVAQGITWKQSVQAATAAALPTNVYNNGASGVGATLTGVSNGALTVDGYTVVVSDRLLIKNEATAANNGIYTVTATGSGISVYVLTRATDYDQPAEVIAGTAAFVEQGTTNADKGFVQTTTGTIIIGTTALSFTQFTGLGEVTAGTGLTKSGDTISLITPVVIANGGTNSTTSLSGNKNIRSSSTAIIEDQITSDGSGNLGAVTSVASNSSNPATAGFIRLASTDAIEWRNNANSGNISLAKNTSDFLTYNGNTVLDQVGTGLTQSNDTVSLSTPVSTANGGTGQTTYTDGQLLIGKTTGNTLNKTTLTGTTNQITVTNGSGTITLSTPQDIATSSSPTFASETLTNTTNQLVLGTTRTVTITAPTPATSSRTWTIPDLATSPTFAALEGTQTFSGSKTFSSNLTLSSSIAVVFTDNTTNTVNMKATNSTTSWTFSLPTTAGSNTNVLTTDGSGNTSWSAAGSGTVNSGTATHLSYYATSTNAVSDASGHSINGSYTLTGGAGALTLSSSTIAMGANKITGLANGSASDDAAAFGQVTPLFAYRRPNLVYSSGTVVSIATGLDGTSGDAVILFPDGNLRTETSSSRYQATTTQNAVFTNATLGNNQGGIRSGSVANNTWYAAYAVKVTTFAANWVMVLDTVFPTQGNFSTLNSNFGTNSWVFLGYVPYGDGVTGNAIKKFVQVGNVTYFTNSATTGNGQNGNGLRFATTAGASSLTWTYATGSSISSAQLPDTINAVQAAAGFTGVSGIAFEILDSSGSWFYARLDATNATLVSFWINPSNGAKCEANDLSSRAQTIYINAISDTALGIGSNPLL